MDVKDWIDVDERLPVEKGTYLIVVQLVAKKPFSFATTGKFEPSNRSPRHQWDCDPGVTHWQPIPALPPLKYVCSMCRWWSSPMEPPVTAGQCKNRELLDALCYDGEVAAKPTRPGFGCVFWEPRDWREET